jgi:uncharacterized protein (TIGR03067 family)
MITAVSRENRGFGLLMVLAASMLPGCGGKSKPTELDGPPQAGQQTAGKPDSEDLNRLKGIWRVVSIEAAGQKVPDDRVLGLQLDWVFDGDRMTVKRPNKPDQPGTLTLEGTNPKRLTITKTGTPPMRALYAFEGAKLKVCVMLDENPNAGFPSGLVSAAAPKTDLLILERR